MNTIYINGDIAPFSYGWSDVYDIAQLNADLNAIEDKTLPLTIDINSFGGDVTAGFAMYNIIRRFAQDNKTDITTRISGYCSSIATVIFLAGDKRVGNSYADFFIHNAWTFAVGDKNEMQKTFEQLEKVSNQIAKFYSEKTTIPYETAIELMDNSTNIDSATALEYGFFTEVENEVKAYNSVSIRNMIIENNKKIKPIKNDLKMQTNEKKGILNKIVNAINTALGINNLIVYSDTQEAIDFYELAEDAVVNIGDKANVNDQKANGAFMLADGKTLYTFENGVLSKIELQDDTTEEVEDPATDANDATDVNAQLAEKDTEILNLKTEIESLKNKLVELKGMASNFKIDLENDDKTPAQKNNKIDFNEKIKNFKF